MRFMVIVKATAESEKEGALAAAFLTPEHTIAQGIVRAKRSLAEKHIA